MTKQTPISTTIYDTHKVGELQCDEMKAAFNLHCKYVTKNSPPSQQKACQNLFKNFIHCTLDYYLSGNNSTK